MDLNKWLATEYVPMLRELGFNDKAAAIMCQCAVSEIGERRAKRRIIPVVE